MDVGSVTLALLPSPLLGPAVWQPVAAELVAGGWDVIVPPAYGPVATPQDVLAHLLNSIPATTPVVLVPHSNAGLYAAALAAARDVRGLVFVDAGLPEDDGSTPTAPAELRDFLGDLVGADGRLPPWTRWWAERPAGVLRRPDSLSAGLAGAAGGVPGLRRDLRG